MKKYLLVVAFLSLSVCAENNPFNLQENLQKIDQDQDVLLSALKEMAGDKEIEVDDSINEPRPVTEDNLEALPDAIKREEVADVTEISDKEVKAKKQDIDQLAMQKAEELRLEKVKAEQIKIEQERAKNAEESRLVQKRKERLEVEAYEAKRLAKEKEEKLTLEKKAHEDKVKSEKLKVEIVKEKAQENEHRVADIDIDNENRMAKKLADKEYLDAIREVN